MILVLEHDGAAVTACDATDLLETLERLSHELPGEWIDVWDAAGPARARDTLQTLADRRGIRHGTESRYNHYACRCRPCMDANAAQSRRAAVRLKEREALLDLERRLPLIGEWALEVP